MVKQYNFIDEAQVAHFMKHGYLRLENCFSREQAEQWTSTVWTRLGFDPTDKSTWTCERTNMPEHKRVRVADFAPKAWGAICEAVGGEERITEESKSWNDALIVNLGSPEFEGRVTDPKALPGWHVDGDFFIHFLDSPEQGLLVIPLFTDIQGNAGGTAICPEGVGKIARYLYEHPEGVTPVMNPVGTSPDYEGLEFYCDLVQSCSDFHEMTGKVGDVILLHPLMVHSATHNGLRLPRIITNPPVSLIAPFNFNRSNPEEYSLVEKKTLLELGVNLLPEWKISGRREEVVPERVRVQRQMKLDEENRLRGSPVAVAA